MASWNTAYHVMFLPLHERSLPPSPFPIAPTSAWWTLSSLLFSICSTIPSPARRLTMTFLVQHLCYAYSWLMLLSCSPWVWSIAPVLKRHYFNSNQCEGSEGNLFMCWGVRGSTSRVPEGTRPNKLGVSTSVTATLETIPFLPNPKVSLIILRQFLDVVQQMKIFTLDYVSGMCLSL